MSQQQELKIVYKNWGIADAFPDGVVELNKNLRNYPNLEKALIQHELKHSREAGFTKHDLVHDLTTMNQVSQWEMFKFIMTNPKSLTFLLPAYYSKERGLVYDQNAIIMWCVLIGIIGLGIWIA